MTTSITVDIDPTNVATLCIVQGITLMLEYEPSATFSAEHDTLFFASYSTSQQMTEKELKLMDDWGWFEECNSWAIHVFYQSVNNWPKNKADTH